MDTAHGELHRLAQSRPGADSITMAVAWNSRGSHIAGAMSDGQAVVWDAHGGLEGASPVWQVAAHSLMPGVPAEVWAVEFSASQPHSVWTGGDDATMKRWDTREHSARAALTCKEHTMGVCTIAAHPSLEHILGTGCYDGQFRVCAHCRLALRTASRHGPRG